MLGFALAILLGSLVLSLPTSSAPGVITSYIDALFISTSAVCVTGLTTVPTATHWSLQGKIVILTLIQLGGLGILTASALFALFLGKKFTLKERLLMQEALGQYSIAGLVRLTRYILALTFGVEAIGAVLLALRFSLEMSLPRAIWFGLFHSVSAFCNAGFDLFGDSLERYVSDWPVSIIVSTLFVIGGIGFVVIADLYQTRGKWQKLSLHSKVALTMTALLIVTGTLAIFTFEYGNTLRDLRFDAKVLAAYFHSVTPRTAGFNTLPTGKFLAPTLLVTIVLMFIGASSGGTGGGIKVTTFAMILAAVASITSGRETTVGKRSIGRETIERSLAIAVLSMALLLGITLVLTLSEKHDFLAILFETTSAFGTVGLSTGITPELTSTGKLGLIVLMFAGRLGPLTLAMALTQQKAKARMHYPEERLMVG